jgi:hypothetical protein
LAALRAALGAARRDLDGRLLRLHEGGFCESAGGSCPLARLAEDGDAALRAFLSREGKDACLAVLGGGSVNPGRGDAELTWTDPSSREGTRFVEEALPPGGLRLEDTRLLAVESVAPDGLEAGEHSTGGGLRAAAAGGGAAHTATVLPRHRGAVRRYFERGAGSDGEGAGGGER